jgi:DNA-directed RNA polymerase specialized sigma24 family protein
MRAVATDAAAHKPKFSATTLAAMTAYLHALPEPQRTLYRKWDQGMSAFEIAASMNMERRSVARVLAKVYSQLRVIAQHYETKQPVHCG